MARVRFSSFFFPCFTVFLPLLWIFGQLPCCLAGQIFTDGLSIINSPQPGNPAHIGSPIAISVEVSDNGMLPLDATNTNSSSATHYDSLEIYLVSSQTGKNFTVASGSEFLDEEAGSVRHCNWNVPACVPEGQYNLTFYERSHINGQPYFTITSISIPVENSQDSTDVECTDLSNNYLGQPQNSSPPSPPFFHGGQGSPTRTSGMVISYTGSASETASTPTGPVLITITLSASEGLPFPFPPTVTVTVPSISVSMSEVVSLTTVTSVQGASTITFLETSTSLATVTVTPSGNPSGQGGPLIPINSGCITRTTLAFLLIPFSILWSLV